MKYQFFKDTLCKLWYRDCIEIEADSYEEAKIKTIELVKNYEDLDYSIWTEPLFETYQEISLDDNDYFSTLELQDSETNNIIYENGK